MRPLLLLAAATLFAATLAPGVSADVTVRQCGPDVGCSDLGATISTDLADCVVTLPAELGREYPLVRCESPP